jgi:hypothetical protein
MTAGSRRARSKKPSEAAVRRYLVYRDATLMLEVTAEPGPLLSKSAPPPRPGESPVMHPFLSATAHVPEHEAVLREALDRSKTLEEYLARLRSMGFRVVEARPS